MMISNRSSAAIIGSLRMPKTRDVQTILGLSPNEA